MITIEGRLERITYRNEDNYYTVARFKTAQAEVTITIQGEPLLEEDLLLRVLL